MKVVFRTDASAAIGTGHVMRCRTLADRLAKSGADVHFVCRAFDVNPQKLISARNCDVHVLPFDSADHVRAQKKSGYEAWLGVEWDRDAQDTIGVLEDLGGCDLLVIDHYGLNARWEKQLRPHAMKIAAIDDLANRAHICDILIDQNLGHDDGRYDSLVPSDCNRLLGSNYAILRDEFVEARPNIREKSNGVRNILIFFGGIDATDETTKALRAVDKSDFRDVKIDVVIGAGNAHRNQVIRRAGRMSNVTVRERVTQMSQLMFTADICLGGAGTTSWERCCMGLPTLMVAVAENQESIAQAVHDAGAGRYLGTPTDVTEQTLADATAEIMQDCGALADMSRAAASVVDGQGTDRVAAIMLRQDVPAGASI